MKVNKFFPFDRDFLKAKIELRQLESISKQLSSVGEVFGRNEAIWAIKILTLTDLTTLSGDDTASNVRRLCIRAAYPFSRQFFENALEEEIQDKVHTAAVCVYPARVKDAYETLKHFGKLETIPIAAVATGFPSGQFGLSSRLREIADAIDAGATEIDIVINRSLALTGKWLDLYDEVIAMRKACGDKAHLKTILATGELGSMENIYKASMVCMLAGADFIKTSTGKEAVNATLPVGLCMIYAIREFRYRTGQMVGLKPAGGVRTTKEAIAWLTLVKETLGDEWLTPELFRIGASGLLDDVEKVVMKEFPNYDYDDPERWGSWNQ